MYSVKRSKPKKDVAEANLELQMRSNISLDLEASLHQSAEDNSIVASFTSLRGYIESHTLEFYHSEPVHIDIAELKIELVKILPSVPASSLEALAHTLLQPESRPAGIRAVIAHMLLASVDFCGDFERTILSPFAIAHMSTFDNSQDWTAEMQQGTSQEIFTESISANAEQYISMHYRNGGFYQRSCYLHQMVDPEASLLVAILGA